jgi:ubiquinone/menaquinone biosynthesis C-methylase UbiE
MNKKSASKRLTSNDQRKTTPTTSWGGVAEWYDEHLALDTYHEKVIMPNLFRMMGEVERKDILDLACGQGHISRVLVKGGARVTGADISAELITFAKTQESSEKWKDGKLQAVTYITTPSHKLDMIKSESKDMIICVLAIQNIEKVAETFKECNRILRPEGKLFMVMNHPSFRIPQGSRWGYDEEHEVQYRRIDQYLSEAKIRIDMTPGKVQGKEYTISFHRPLQFYSKLLGKAGLAITRIEEWESHKKSGKGPRQKAEDTARKEIPLFMALELAKLH